MSEGKIKFFKNQGVGILSDYNWEGIIVCGPKVRERKAWPRYLLWAVPLIDQRKWAGIEEVSPELCLIVFRTSPFPYIQDLFVAEWNDWKFPPWGRGGRCYIWDVLRSEIHLYFRCLMNTSFRVDAGSVLCYAHSRCFIQNICILIGYAGLPTAEHLLCFTALRLLLPSVTRSSALPGGRSTSVFLPPLILLRMNTSITPHSWAFSSSPMFPHREPYPMAASVQKKKSYNK